MERCGCEQTVCGEERRTGVYPNSENSTSLPVERLLPRTGSYVCCIMNFNHTEYAHAVNAVKIILMNQLFR